jgi:hypothetical protein
VFSVQRQASALCVYAVVIFTGTVHVFTTNCFSWTLCVYAVAEATRSSCLQWLFIFLSGKWEMKQTAGQRSYHYVHKYVLWTRGAKLSCTERSRLLVVSIITWFVIVVREWYFMALNRFARFLFKLRHLQLLKSGDEIISRKEKKRYSF